MLSLKPTTKEGAIDRDGNVYCSGVWWKPWRLIPTDPSKVTPRPMWDIHKELYWNLTTGKPVPPGCMQGLEGRKYHFMRFVDEIWGRTGSIYPFEWHPFAVEMLEKKLEHNFLMVAGGGSLGKSRFGALWAISNFLFYPFHTKVLVTSMTLKAAEGKIWGDIHEAWQQACRAISEDYGCKDVSKAESYMPGKYLAVGVIKYDLDSTSTKKAGLELIACDANSAKDSAEKVQGYHRGRVIAVLDELATLNHQIMTTIESNIFTNPHSDVIGLFNPDSYFDPAGKASAPVDGWSTVGIDTTGWKNKNGWTMRLDGARSPNVVAGYEKYKGLLTKEKYEEAKLTKTDKEFNKMYRAWWTAAGSKEAIYQESEIIQYYADRPMNPREWLYPPTPCSFLDPSFAHGGDKAALQFGECGEAIINGKKMKILNYTDLINIDATLDPTKPKGEQIVAAYIAENRKRNVNPRYSGIDATSGNLELLIARDWSNDILLVKFGERASDEHFSKVDKTPCREKYDRMVSEIWYSSKLLIRAGQIRGLHNEVVNQMTSRFFEENKSGKIQVESKDEMKKRALKSPNEADASLSLAFLCRKRMGLIAEESIHPQAMNFKTTSFKEVAKEMASISYEGITFVNGGSLWG